VVSLLASMTRALLLGLAACVAGCAGEIEPPGPCDLTNDLLGSLAIHQVRIPLPMLAGSQLQVRGESFLDDPGCVEPEVAFVDGDLVVPLSFTRRSNNELSAALTPAAAELLGSSVTFDGELRVLYRSVDGGVAASASLALRFPLAEAIVPEAMAVFDGPVYLDDEVVVEGDGFIGGDEGSTDVVASGTFTPTSDPGSPTVVTELRLPSRLLDPQERNRLGFHWSPRLGGLAPGRFDGELRFENDHRPNGRRVEGTTLSAVFDQEQTELYRLDPATVSLGQIGVFLGRGFIGRPGTDEGTTTIRLEGTFTPRGGVAVSFERELVGAWITGADLAYTVTVNSSEEEGVLQAVDFGRARGAFDGTATPVLTAGVDRVEGIGVDLAMTLGPVRQICWVQFLPGFSDSLELFGLGAVEAEIRERILVRMQEFYHPPDRPYDWVNVEFRAEEPTDFYEGGYAILDIGGPDPNGLGLFGYDNTVGKDVGNLRLHDHIGGENALGLLDGHGYGGVFVDSMMFWSEHPPFDWRPPSSPPPDPRFDAIFDPVRSREVVAGELDGGADPARVAQIEEAIRVFANIVADTAAHEFAHSLGLAQPYGSADEYHATFPLEGCLMDQGQDRPLAERALLDGNPGAQFCGEDRAYLLEILPME
jgi:hypothetical protein